MPIKSSVTNQTLDRGLTALAYIAESAIRPTVDDLAAALDIHRSMAYRIVRTLEKHGLVQRDDAGRCQPWLRLNELARGVRVSLSTVARPLLENLARELALTIFLVVAFDDEAITVDSAEPPQATTTLGYRPGSRHPLQNGAPGLALLAGAPPLADERRAVTVARGRGWAQSAGEVVPGLGSIATWIPGPGDQPIAALACLYLSAQAIDSDQVGERLREGAAQIATALDGQPTEP